MSLENTSLLSLAPSGLHVRAGGPESQFMHSKMNYLETKTNQEMLELVLILIKEVTFPATDHAGQV